ncbi:hypothetical protein HK102_009589 [Quaeritorhiza haematococci]|nr:hypothetical protein HK102_009589 [Quaeritorhiza haematococci]
MKSIRVPTVDNSTIAMNGVVEEVTTTWTTVVTHEEMPIGIIEMTETATMMIVVVVVDVVIGQTAGGQDPTGTIQTTDETIEASLTTEAVIEMTEEVVVAAEDAATTTTIADRHRLMVPDPAAETASALGSMGGARSSSSLSLPGGAAPTTQQQLAQLLGSGGNASTLGAGGGAAQQRFGGTGGGDGMSNMLATLQNAFMQQQQQQQQQQQAGLKADEFPLPRRYGNQVPECQVIVLGEVDRKFIWHIEGVMKGTGITTETLFLSPKLSLRAVVQQMIAEGVRGVLFLERQHERAGTVSMQVFGRDGGVSEYDNIRLQDAAAIMLRERELRGHPGGNPAAPPAVNNALNNLFGQPQAPHPSLGPALGAGAGLNVSSIATVLSTLAASGGADPATLMNLVTALQAASSQQQQQQQQPQANAALAGLLPGLAAAAAAPNAGAGGMGFGGLPPGLAGLAGLAGLQQQQQQQQPPQLAPQQPGVNQQAGGMAQLLTTLLGAGAAGPAAAAAMGLGNATMGHAPQAGAQQPGPFGSALPRMGLGGPESGNAPGSLPPTSASLGAPSAPSNTSAGGAGSNASGGPRNAGSGPSQNQGNGPQAVGDILNRLKELSQMQQTLQTVSGPGASAPTTIHANQAVSQPGGLPGLLTANVSSMGAPGQQQQHQPGGQRGRVGGPSPTIASGGPLGMAPTSAAPPGSAAVAAAAQQLGNGMNAQQLMSLLQGLASNAANRPGGK